MRERKINEVKDSRRERESQKESENRLKVGKADRHIDR